MSRPTEHTQVIASSFSSVSAPALTASIIPISSLTGIKAPLRPPTWLLAMIPPFFTASLSSASAAVVPGAPAFSSPISVRIWATESPRAGVGARLRSTIPNGMFSRLLASLATSCPTRVILKAVRLIVSATTSNGAPFTCSSATFTTPGPETPTLIAHSGSPTPQNAPAMKGLSSTAFAKTTSLAQPRPSCSAVSSAVRLMISPISFTAFILIPARVEATLTLEQSSFVSLSTSGIEASRRSSARVAPLCIRAEYPPRKLTPTSAAARSSASAIGRGSSWQIRLTGVTLIRLFTIGIPSSVSISSPVFTRSRAVRQIFSYTRSAHRFASRSEQSSRLIPSVIVRISKFSCWIMCIVWRISLVSIIGQASFRSGASRQRYPSAAYECSF